MNDGQIWMLKVLKIYFVEQVLRFDHKDFLTALRDDLPPLLSNIGVFIMENWINRLNEQGDKAKAKQVKVALEIIKKVDQKGMVYLEKESKYHLTNKFSPKKCPDEKKVRSEIKMLYSYKFYARPEYFENERKLQREAELAVQRSSAIKCNSCGSPEGKKKHKVCSACKKTYYCTADCQKVDWKRGHKTECKKLKAAK